MKQIVIIVHGTWAEDGIWWRDDAHLLRASIKQEMPDVEFVTHRWTGANKHIARSDGAILLRRRLQNLVEKHTDAELYIIAHSHGGNLVRYALAGFDIALRIKKMVFLSTPFVWAFPRDFSRQIAILSGLLAYVATGMSVLLISLPLSGLQENGSLDWLWGILILISSIIAFFPIRARLSSYAVRRQNSTLERLFPEGELNMPVLCVRLERDEATLGLGMADWIGNLPSRLLDWYERKVLKNWWKITKRLSIIGGLIMMFKQSGGRMTAGLIIAVTLFSAAMLTWPIIAIFGRFYWRAVGVTGEKFADFFFVSLPVSIWPPSCTDVSMRVFESSLPIYKLRHSVYESEEAVRVLTGWLKDGDQRERQSPVVTARLLPFPEGIEILAICTVCKGTTTLTMIPRHDSQIGSRYSEALCPGCYWEKNCEGHELAGEPLLLETLEVGLKRVQAYDNRIELWAAQFEAESAKSQKAPAANP